MDCSFVNRKNEKTDEVWAILSLATFSPVIGVNCDTIYPNINMRMVLYCWEREGE